jgi:uncharacterized protein YoxC
MRVGLRSHWLHVAAAFLIGAGITGAITGGVSNAALTTRDTELRTTTGQWQHKVDGLQSALADVTDNLKAARADAREQADRAATAYTDAQAAADQVLQSDKADLETKYRARKAALDARTKSLDARSRALDARSKRLNQRAAAVSQAETSYAADTIPGDGTYVVGVDITAGTYRTSGPAAGNDLFCYWARLSSTDGSFDAIITNGNTAGPTTVTIAASDKAFEVSGCADWHKVG